MARTATLVRPTRADAPPTDRDLICRFAADNDEAAFEVLFRRHGPMVLAAARRVLGNSHDAEDVCQATFLVLAKKAGTEKWRTTVAPWLHRTAHLMALKARTAAARRAKREGKAAKAAGNPLAEMSGQDLMAVLDAEILALPGVLREPIVLCYLEGATRDEAADRLGCPLSTLKNRLERGRDRLHAALVRRGLGLSTVLLGTLLVRSNRAAGTELFAQRTASAAAAIAGGRPPVVADSVRQLIEGTAMTRLKLKALIGVVLLGGLVASTGAIAGRGGDNPPAKEPPAKEAAKPVEPVPAAKGEMRVTVLDPDGKPLSGANVQVGIWTDEPGFKSNQDVETDASGVATAKLPKSYNIVRLWADKKPFAGLFAGWEQNELSSGKRMPAAYTFRLGKATTAGGRVVDEAGKPIAGAKVSVDLASDPKPPHGDGRVRFNGYLAGGTEPAITDAAGHWKIDTVPDHPEVELAIRVTHPDFVSDPWEQPAAKLGITPEMLRKGTATIALQRGVICRGRVTDPDGNPVKNAIVIHGDDPYGGRETCKFPTDADGRFRLPALPARLTTLTVIAAGWAPQMRKVQFREAMPEHDFRLEPGKPARLKFVDGAGKPVPGASVYLHEWKGSKSIYSDHNPNHPKVPATGIPKKADAAGMWEWKHAPSEPVKISIYAKGFAELQTYVTGGAAERTVTLKAEHRITGRVTDAVTGKPIPQFTIIPIDVFRKDHLSAERFHAKAGKDGKLDFWAERADIPLRIRIEAPGYRVQDGPEFRTGDDAARTQDFKLQPSPPRTGTVVDEAGKPVTGAAVLMATPTEQINLDSEMDGHVVHTDLAGRFEFPDPGTAWSLVVRSEGGIAFADLPADKFNAGPITVRPWASVKGRFVDGGRPVREATVFVTPIRAEMSDGPQVYALQQGHTDADGRFEFPRVPPGPVSIRVQLGPWQDHGYRSGPAVPLDLKPGQKATVELGSGGASLTGKVKLTGKVPADLNCTYSLNHLVRREPGVTPPVGLTGFDIRKGFQESWTQSREGLAYVQTLRSWFVKLAPDGSFRISGVPAGEYDLAVSIYAKPTGCLIDPVARAIVRVSVSEADVAKGERIIPEIAADVKPVPDVGDTPVLAFERPDGKSGSLADVKGKYTVLHFWASWCGPCKQQLPAVRKLHETFAARGVTVLSLSLDDDPAAWAEARTGLPWAHGRLTAPAAGVSSVPAYWLLDPAGKIVAKGYDPEDLEKVLADNLK
jgi:RNA polymerase sigma factor (sigma-70 family)